MVTSMKIEHFGYMVEDPAAVAAWYCEHLGFRIARKMDSGPHTHFLVDSAEQMMLEIYNNSKAQVPDYVAMDPLVLHLAFAADDVATERARLLEAGATSASDPVTTSVGDTLAMLRDPWGLAFQLCHRATPMA